MRKALTAFVCVLVFGAAAWAQEKGKTPKVAVAPFTVNSPERTPQTEKTLRDLIAAQLAEHGLAVPGIAELDRAMRGPLRSDGEARAAGRAIKADYVIYGSLNQLGRRVSLDARLVDVSGGKPAEVLMAEQTGMENLAAGAVNMARQVAGKLLEKALISEIAVSGNQRIETDAILAMLKTKKGEILRSDVLRDDIKTVYQSGYFEDVQAQVTDGPTGKVLTFTVREKPSVTEVKLVGNKQIKDKDIFATITTKPFTILQQNIVADDVQRILRVYAQKAYSNAEVTSSIEFPRNPREAVVTFTMKENSKVFIEKIGFTGNKAFSSKKLRGIMKTQERGWLGWILDEGVLQEDVLNVDVDRLSAAYYDEGYMDAKVGTPEVKKEKKGFSIIVPIQEGDRYKVSSYTITGDAAEDADKFKKKMKLKEGQYFSREKLRDDVDRINRNYTEAGHAYSETIPRIKQDKQAHTTTVALETKKGPVVHIEHISVAGNTKTRDKVIRRQVKLAEGERYDSKKLEQSNVNLRKLDYFEEVEIAPSEGSTPDSMNLGIKVKEKTTGAISVGGGYSSDEGFFTGGEIYQRNLFGRGQFLGLKAQIGQEAQRYSASFTEPNILDSDVSGGFDIFNWARNYPDYTKDAVGGRMRFGNAFGNYSHLYYYYTYEDVKISDVATDSAQIIQDQAGRQKNSYFTLTLERDTTDDPFLPTRGTFASLTGDYSIPVLGSDVNYLRGEANLGVYFPLLWQLSGAVKLKAGYIDNLDNSREIPVYERFYLGGVNSVRAFKWGDLGPKDPTTGDFIGGTKYGQATLEVLFPLFEKLNIYGVAFYDAGQAFLDDESFDIMKFRDGPGLGIRWRSPLGPLRVEYGYNMHRKKGEDSGAFQFSTGINF